LSLKKVNRSTSGDDFDDFEAVARLDLALGKFGRGDGFAVVFDDYAAGEEILGDQKLVEWARKIAFDPPVIGDDKG
jgi:hypothetical protein